MFEKKKRIEEKVTGGRDKIPENKFESWQRESRIRLPKYALL